MQLTAQPAPDRIEIHADEPDLGYLRPALARAGRKLEADALAIEVLAGGRSGQPVFALKALRQGRPIEAFVLKTVSEESARPRALGGGCIEAKLWQAGVLQSLPAPLSCPALDLAWNAATRRWWLLMDDVSPGIMGRGVYDFDKLALLMRAMAAMHARYWERADELKGIVASLPRTAAKFTEAVALFARNRPAPDWARQILDETPLIGAFLPKFLDVLGPRDADFYLDLCEHRAIWVDALNALPKTLSQGDLRRANVAIFADHVSLFDWDVAAYAPAACDLQWYWFLQFWAYPPNDGKTPEDRAPLLQSYVQALEAALGGTLDRELFRKSWDLAWVRVFAELGFCLADQLAGEHTSEDRARVAQICKRAVAVTRRACDAHV